MTYDEIIEQWSKDSYIDKARLDYVSLSIPQLHNKYFKMLSRERMVFKKLETDLSALKVVKTEYYMGTLDDDTIKENGWVQWDRRILKGDLHIYMDADQDIIKLKLKISMAFERVELINSILGQLNSMQWNIKNALAFMAFQAGN